MQRALGRERFVLPDECDFDYLYAQRDAANIGELINIALEKHRRRQQGQARKRLPQHRLQLRAGPRADQGAQPPAEAPARRLQRSPARPAALAVGKPRRDRRRATSTSSASSPPAPARRPASSTRRRRSRSCWPSWCSPKPGDRICDPACGSGSLLIQVGQGGSRRRRQAEQELLALRPGIERQHLGAVPA